MARVRLLKVTKNVKIIELIFVRRVDHAIIDLFNLPSITAEASIRIISLYLWKIKYFPFILNIFEQI